MEESMRPAKRLKTGGETELTPKSSAPVPSRDDNLPNPKISGPSPQVKTRWAKPSQMSQKKPNAKTESRSTRTFLQPSAICAGDKGIFVTSGKGREKKCLLELYDLVEELLEETGVDTAGQSLKDFETPNNSELPGTGSYGSVSIEAEIAAELEELRERDGKQAGAQNTSKPIQLITLDIPCVSFLRFPPRTSLDPVDIVHRLCSNAADPAKPQRSRFIQRLTPLSNLGKTLNQGLEKACAEVLPNHFGLSKDGTITSTKFAIRPTARNNDKLDRDQIIKLVADYINGVGEAKHTVDLKNYEKGVIVEVYRGWVGICVVDNTNTGLYKQGYEELKRFNIAEIYANR